VSPLRDLQKGIHKLILCNVFLQQKPKIFSLYFLQTFILQVLCYRLLGWLLNSKTRLVPSQPSLVTKRNENRFSLVNF